MTILRDDVLVRSSETISREHAREPIHSAAPESAPGLRIELRRPAGAGTFVDGGWWPHTRDLIVELPGLLAAVETAGYPQVRRINYAANAWDGEPPRKAAMLNRVVKLGGFASQNLAELTLVDSSGWNRVTIAVVPPNTDPNVARRALTLAGTNGDRHTAREILECAARVSPGYSGDAGCVDMLAASGWESEGGQ